MEIQITRLSLSSWFKIKTGETIIHMDPGYSGYFINQGIPVQELQDKAGMVLVSHCHKDHLQPEALAMIHGPYTKVIAPQKCVDRIPYSVTIVKPRDEIEVDGINVRVVEAYNTPAGSSTRKVHHQGDGVGYLISINGITIYHAGDTDLIPAMNQLDAVDVAMLPIGGKFTMDLDEAVRAVEIINPGLVIPMHQSNADQIFFQRKIEERKTVGVALLGIGESFRFKH